MVKCSLLLLAFIGFWCISSGYCCSEKLCTYWSDYFSDYNGCRSTGAVDRVTTKWLSLIPFLGLSNFYKGNTFDGLCELINAVMIVISLLASCSCPNHRDADCVAAYVACFTILLDLAKIFHMIAVESADMFEIVLMVAVPALLICLCCADSAHRGEARGIILAILLTFITGILEIIRDIYTAANYDKDGNDCPFV